MNMYELATILVPVFFVVLVLGMIWKICQKDYDQLGMYRSSLPELKESENDEDDETNLT